MAFGKRGARAAIPEPVRTVEWAGVREGRGMNTCLYEDAEARRLLCYLVEAEGEGGERHFRAYDGEGVEIGAIRRVPPSKKVFKHTWRIEQPGHPVIVGRNEWASGGATEIALRVAGKAIGGAVDSLFTDENVESGKSRQSRKLEWWSGSELVMTSRSIKLLSIHQSWLDRRLAFAFAVLGDR